jgi:hypothetical protein
MFTSLLIHLKLYESLPHGKNDKSKMFSSSFRHTGIDWVPEVKSERILCECYMFNLGSSNLFTKNKLSLNAFIFYKDTLFSLKAFKWRDCSKYHLFYPI